MKGREHEEVAKFAAFVFGIIIIVSLVFNIPILTPIVKYFGSFWFFIALLLFVLGSILPDSDSKNMGSYVYFKEVFGVAYLFKGLEFPIAWLLKRKREHRGSLHTIAGITLTSLALIILLSSIFKNLFEWKGVILAFIFLFLGQLFHLICDIREDWKIKFV